MQTGKKLILLFIYYLLFLSSFYMIFKIKSHIDGNQTGINYDIQFMGFGQSLHSINDLLNLKIIFFMVCALSFLASIFMIYLTISYNLDLVKEKDPYEKEIETIQKSSSSAAKPKESISIKTPPAQRSQPIPVQPAKTFPSVHNAPVQNPVSPKLSSFSQQTQPSHIIRTQQTAAQTSSVTPPKQASVTQNKGPIGLSNPTVSPFSVQPDSQNQLHNPALHPVQHTWQSPQIPAQVPGSSHQQAALVNNPILQHTLEKPANVPDSARQSIKQPLSPTQQTAAATIGKPIKVKTVLKK